MSKRPKYVTATCAALDQNGKRCHASKDLVREDYHGDSEIYGFGSGPTPVWPTWVRVYLCPKHRRTRVSR